MSISQKTACSVALAAGLAFGMSVSQAALMNFTITGEIYFADPDPNGVFNLSVGSTVTATGVFDDSALTGTGSESISFGSGSGNTLTIFVGNSTYVASDDYNFSTGMPELSFSNGAFAGLNFATNDPFDYPQPDTSFSSLDTFFDGYDNRLGFPQILSGTWDTFEMTPVPVPAAVWLFGSGLLGLVGIARRKSAA